MSLNHVRPWRNIYRRKSRQIHVGNVPIGGDAPIAVQTMTNTLTTDVAATIAQVLAAAEAGADIVRVCVPDQDSSKALKEIVKESPVPIVADIHFHYKRGIEAAEAGAACLRINPGNIGSEERVREVIKAARDNNCSMRIGVNAGSLEKHLLEKYGEPCPDAMVESGLDLRDCRGHVCGQCVCHCLHGDGSIPANCNIAHVNLARFTAIDIAPRTHMVQRHSNLVFAVV